MSEYLVTVCTVKKFKLCFTDLVKLVDNLFIVKSVELNFYEVHISKHTC